MHVFTQSLVKCAPPRFMLSITMCFQALLSNPQIPGSNFGGFVYMYFRVIASRAEIIKLLKPLFFFE